MQQSPRESLNYRLRRYAVIRTIKGGVFPAEGSYLWKNGARRSPVRTRLDPEIPSGRELDGNFHKNAPGFNQSEQASHCQHRLFSAIIRIPRWDEDGNGFAPWR